MLHALVAAALLPAAFAVPADAALPIGFRLQSATVLAGGLALRYTTACPPGVTEGYALSVSVAQRTGAHVADAAGTLRESCAGRSRHLMLATDPGGVAFHAGLAYVRVWGCVEAGCSGDVVPLRLA
jgi:hypothetical protein